jgi:hypothetical protein
MIKNCSQTLLLKDIAKTSQTRENTEEIEIIFFALTWPSLTQAALAPLITTPHERKALDSRAKMLSGSSFWKTESQTRGNQFIFPAILINQEWKGAPPNLANAISEIKIGLECRK